MSAPKRHDPDFPKGALTKSDYDSIYKAFVNDRIFDEFYAHVIKYLEMCREGIIVPPFMRMYKTLGETADKEAIRQYILSRFALHLTRNNRLSAMTDLNNLYPFKSSMIEGFNPGNYTTYEFFVVLGDYMSTDIDVVIILTRDIDDPNNKIKKLTASEVKRFHKEICDIYGRDVIDELDVSYAIIDDTGRILNVSKGGDPTDGANETCNIIMNTYHHHPQTQVALDFITTTGFVLYDMSAHIDDKIRSVIMYVFRHLEYFVDDDTYTIWRDTRRKVYDGADMTPRASEILPEIIYDLDDATDRIKKANTNGHYAWKSRMKALTMKLLQTIFACMDRFDLYSFVKMELAANSAHIVDHYKYDDIDIMADELVDACRYYLSRGSCGSYSDNCMPYLFRIYTDIVAQFEVTGDVSDHDVPVLDIDPDVQTKFVESPVTPSDSFRDAWLSAYGDPVIAESCDGGTTVGSVFTQDLTEDSAKLEDFKVSVSEVAKYTLDSVVKMVSQRSPEWLAMLEYFTCGNNNSLRKETFEGYFNLMRGCIEENMISHVFPGIMEGYIDMEKAIIIDVGMCVAGQTEGSTGGAPDKVILINDCGRVEFIPCEFKSLKYGSTLPRRNSDYRRGISLARRQNMRIKEIVDTYATSCVSGITVKRGVIVLSWIYESRLYTETYVYDL